MAVTLFETRAIDVSSPVNLSADADLAAAADDPLRGWAFVQNTGTAAVHWRESTTAPDAAETEGHVLDIGDGILAHVLVDLPFYVWAPGGAGTITVSPGSPTPVRQT